MRNTLQEQYNLIKEGKGNKDSFMRNALRQFPNLITPTLGFDMTVNILKQRQVISEAAGGIVTKGVEQDWVKLFKENTEGENKKTFWWIMIEKDGKRFYLKDSPYFSSEDEAHAYAKEKNVKDYTLKSREEKVDKDGKIVSEMYGDSDGDRDFDIESEIRANEYYDKGLEAYAEGDLLKAERYYKAALKAGSWLNWTEEDLPPYETITKLTEAKKVKAKIAKTDTDVLAKETAGYDYKDKKNYDNVYGQEFLVGYYAEMKDPKNAEKTVDELKKIVAKNLESDSSYYVKKGQFGVKDLGYMDNHPGLGPTKEVKGKYKSSGMEPVKIKESIIKKIDFLIKEGLDLKEIETVAEVAALEAKMAKVEKEKEKREKKIKALETLAEMDKDVVSKEGLNTLKKEIKLLEKMANDIKKKQDKLNGVKKEVLTSTDENLDNMSETEETEN